MTLIRQLLIATLLVAGPATGRADDADAARDLVLLSADGPVFVQILLQVDGRGFRAQWRDYADRVFADIDADADHFLSGVEADAIPAFISSTRQATEQRTLFALMDVEPADGQVSPAEFREFVVASLGRALAIRPSSTTRTQAVGMFPRLDRDRNGQLTADEVEQGYAALRVDDIDANDVIGIDEILPPQDPTMPAEVQAGAGSELDLPFIELRDGPLSAERTVEILLSRYARPAETAAGAPAVGLTQTQLALDEAGMSRCDANRDGLLDAQELLGLLRQPQPRVQFLVELKVRSIGRPRISLLSDRDKLTGNVRQESGSRLRLSLAGTDVTLAASRPRTTTSDASRFFGLQFRIADADKNQYVDAAEFARLQLPATEFSAVDKDGDGKVFREELTAYVDSVNGAAGSQLLCTISKEGRTLFQMLDENGDLRLTRREFQEAPTRLAELDANGDGQFAETEFRNRYSFSFRSGEPPLLPSGSPQDTAAMQNQTTPIVRNETAGPAWFQRMDRNRDGDVSQREFLGSPEAFRRFDRDDDGLLTADEAEAAGKSE